MNLSMNDDIYVIAIKTEENKNLLNIISKVIEYIQKEKAKAVNIQKSINAIIQKKTIMKGKIKKNIYLMIAINKYMKKKKMLQQKFIKFFSLRFSPH